MPQGSYNTVTGRLTKSKMTVALDYADFAAEFGPMCRLWDTTCHRKSNACGNLCSACQTTPPSDAPDSLKPRDNFQCKSLPEHMHVNRLLCPAGPGACLSHLPPYTCSCKVREYPKPAGCSGSNVLHSLTTMLLLTVKHQLTHYGNPRLLLCQLLQMLPHSSPSLSVLGGAQELMRQGQTDSAVLLAVVLPDSCLTCACTG